jgi:hypothetical protein
MAMEHSRKPLIAYAGQSSAELLAAKKTHNSDSVMWALASAIQAKRDRGQPLSMEEAVVAAVVSLHREAHAQGLRAFLAKSPDAGQIIEQFLAIGATKAAAILSEQRRSKRKNLDEDYFALTEIEPKLWAFIEKNCGHIDVPAMRNVPAMDSVESPSPSGLPIEDLYSLLEDSYFNPKNEAHCIRKARTLAARLHAPPGTVPISEEQIEGAALWFLLGAWLEEGRFEDCASIGDRVLARAGSAVGFEFLSWAELLLDQNQPVEADRWAAAYLRQARPGLKKTAEWDSWKDLLRKHKKRLPQAALAAGNLAE